MSLPSKEFKESMKSMIYAVIAPYKMDKETRIQLLKMIKEVVSEALDAELEGR